MKLGILILLTLIHVRSYAGHETGSGGDTVICEPSADNAFLGLYALDYLATFSPASSAVEVKSWEDSHQRIRKILRERSDYLADSFEDFLKYIDNESDFAAPRLWVPSVFGLVDIKDEKLIRKLPPNCYKVKDPQTVSVVQSVVRITKPDTILYEYDSAVLRKLRSERPLQYSYLMVHEWLWDVTRDSDALRRLNHLIHSPQIERLNEEGFYEALDAFGFTQSGPFVSVCDRSRAVKERLEVLTGTSCEKIEGMPFEKEYIEFESYRPANFRSGDFSGMGRIGQVGFLGGPLFFPEFALLGMTGLREFSVKKGTVEKLYPRMFYYLSRLTTIRLAGVGLKTLPRSLYFRGGSEAVSINLSWNEIVELPSKLMPPGQRFDRLYLTNNHIKKVPSGFLVGVLGGGVDLSNNAIDTVETGVDFSGISGISLAGNPRLKEIPERVMLTLRTDSCVGLNSWGLSASFEAFTKSRCTVKKGPVEGTLSICGCK